MWSIHTIGYYSVTPRNEVLIQAMSWINLENVVLNAGGQTQSYIETKSRFVVARSWKGMGD